MDGKFGKAIIEWQTETFERARAEMFKKGLILRSKEKSGWS